MPRMNTSTLNDMINDVLGEDAGVKVKNKASSSVKAPEGKMTASELLTAKFVKLQSKGKDIPKMLENLNNVKPTREGIAKVANKLAERFDVKTVEGYLKGIKTGKLTVRNHLGWLLQGRVPTEARLIAMSKGTRGTYSLWHESQTVKTDTKAEIGNVLSQYKAETEPVEQAPAPKVDLKKLTKAQLLELLQG